MEEELQNLKRRVFSKVRNQGGGTMSRALVPQAERCKFESPLHQTRVINIGSDCSFAKHFAFGSENCGSFRYHIHVKEPSLVKVISSLA
jgi:hypothetical protein